MTPFARTGIRGSKSTRRNTNTAGGVYESAYSARFFVWDRNSLAPPCPGSTVLLVIKHIVKVQQWLGGMKLGVEIGAFKYPIPGISPIYVDKYASFANEPCLADYEGEAVSLPFKDSSLDFVASSHVLEHVANPVRALLEWYRVVRPGGVIYFIVPDRRFTWDHRREPTPVAHMMDDFAAGKTPCDSTHIDDFVYNIDWATYSPSTPADKVDEAKKQLSATYWHAVNCGAEINIHFHVFEPTNTLELVRRIAGEPGLNIQWSIVDSAERFPAENPIGFLCVIRVKKSFLERLSGIAKQLVDRRGVMDVLVPAAKKFDTQSPH